MNTAKNLFLMPLILLVGCTGEIKIEGQGDVLSESGAANCYLENQKCETVVSTAFKETFTAIPRAGWSFSGWKYCQESEGNVCRMDIDAETNQLAWGRDLPPLTAVFEELRPLGDQYITANVFGCSTVGIPVERHCPPRIGNDLSIRAKISTGEFSWSFSYDGGGGSSLVYQGEYTMTDDGFVFSGTSGVMRLTAVVTDSTVVLARGADVWTVTQTAWKTN